MMSNLETKDFKERYMSQFQNYENTLNGQTKTFLHELRKSAIASLNEMSFPTQKVEEWKYTNINPFNLIDPFNPFTLNLDNSAVTIMLSRNDGNNLIKY